MKTYTELIEIEGLTNRLHYLMLSGKVGAETFGRERHLNQRFYRSHEWKMLRRHVIVRDLGCDLGVAGYDIFSNIHIHHMNPITPELLIDFDESIVDPEYLICASLQTHNAIHYSDVNQLTRELVDRAPGDTTPWKVGS